ncbi:aminopeptidase P family protein [Hwanghaeella grinnelliae]|uniref:Aminopeptidase P family protein n=1 Tax=Hwanghaeella grinnelliae TaxID=2500179 RepID=A0A437QVI8_9PROT|nr:Xaa-Pro peptidase family protein [Hwanghaeella grinnelliae]RVU38515.1 aminopeptidase P family protein [Hwanghaeella grinnelliae]
MASLVHQAAENYATLSMEEEQAIGLRRLRRVREQAAHYRLSAVILFDPVNIRYATGARNMQVYSARNPARFVFIPVQGPVVLFEYRACEHLSAHLDTIDEIRPAQPIMPLHSGYKHVRHQQDFVAAIEELVAQHGVNGRRIGIEATTTGAVLALANAGFEVMDAQIPVERARALKVPGEIDMIRSSLRLTEAAVREMEEALVPGVSENELWSRLHQKLISGGGDYIETRLLTSGSHTNPWFQETSEKIINAGDLVAFDTDAVGCYGYYSDFSRTFLAGDGPASPAQRTLYALAQEQIETNIELLRAGVAFREYSEKAWPIPHPYQKHRYLAVLHGCGMTGEYPIVSHAGDWEAVGHDDDEVFLPGMTVCVESFIGHEDGGEGVKLEEQVLITNDGVERLSTYGYCDRLSACQRA